jgi:hypothetical protein
LRTHSANITGSFSDLCEPLRLENSGPPEFAARHQLQNELSKIRAFYQKLPLQHPAQKTTFFATTLAEASFLRIEFGNAANEHAAARRNCTTLLRRLSKLAD